MSSARIVPTLDGLQLYTPFDRNLVYELKARIPHTDRKPIYASDKFSHWLVSAKYLNELKLICEHAGYQPTIQGNLFSAAPEKATKILEVKYIGAPKERDDGSKTAFGYSSGDWSVIFPESVLKRWFEGEDAKPDTSTLYGVLAVARGVSGSEIKTAYRRMARRFHPDVNRDEDAGEMFICIKEAYDVLSNPMQRRKYDAALTLCAGQPPPYKAGSQWRPPLRCGLIMAEGISDLGRFVVEKIHAWQPIKNSQGLELVTSWPAGATIFIESWM